MGICGSSEQKEVDKRKPYLTESAMERIVSRTEKNKECRVAEIPESEAIVFKLRIQQDRLKTRVSVLESQEREYGAKVVECLKQNNKQSAKYNLGLKKYVAQHVNDYRMKQMVIDKQIFNIEKTKDDVEFTQLLKESNKVMTRLAQEVDMEELQQAVLLSKDVDSNNERIREMMEDPELDEELARLELELSSVGAVNPDMIRVASQKEDQVKKGFTADIHKSQMQMWMS
jgi:hypothetical protein